MKSASETGEPQTKAKAATANASLARTFKTKYKF